MANILDKILANRKKLQDKKQLKKEAGAFTLNDYIEQAKNKALMSLSAPFRKAPIAGIELAAKTQDVSPEQRSSLNKLQQLFGTEQEQQKTAIGIQENPGKTLAKIGAGQAAVLSPGGFSGKKILPVLSRILAGTGAGALAGFGGSEEGKELEATKKGATTGALVSTGFEAIGALRGIFPKISKGGKNIVRKSQAKIFGKPKQKYGGMKLYDEMDNVGIRSNNIENIADDSLKILNNEGNKLKGQIDDMASQGVRVDVEDVIGSLETKIANTKSSAAKKPLEKVLKELQADFGGQTSMLVDDFYTLKQNYGGLGKWSPGSGADKTVADVYEDVYMSMNDVLDSAFETTGKIPLKELNKKISTAISSLDFVNTQAANKLGSAPLALDEIIAGTGGFIAGGPAGAGVGALGIKAATSPKVQMLGGQALQNIGSLGGGGQQIIPQQLQKILSVGIAGKQPAEATQEQTMQQPQIQQPNIPQLNTDTSNLSPEQQKAMSVIDRAEARSKGGGTGGISGMDITPEMASMAQILLPTKDAAKIKGAFDIQQSAAKTKAKSEEGDGAIKALDQLESLYVGTGNEKSLSLGDKSVGLSGLLAKAKTVGKKQVDQTYVDRLQNYKQTQSFLVGVLNKARDAGVLNAGEYEVMVNNMPNEYSTNKQAKEYFSEVKKYLENTDTTTTETSDIQSLMQMLGQ